MKTLPSKGYYQHSGTTQEHVAVSPGNSQLIPYHSLPQSITRLEHLGLNGDDIISKTHIKDCSLIITWVGRQIRGGCYSFFLGFRVLLQGGRFVRVLWHTPIQKLRKNPCNFWIYTNSLWNILRLVVLTHLCTGSCIGQNGWKCSRLFLQARCFGQNMQISFDINTFWLTDIMACMHSRTLMCMHIPTVHAH